MRVRVETLGRAGLVFCPAYDIDEPDVPWQNVVAFLEAGAAYGSAHVEHILAKLGASRRTEIASWLATIPSGAASVGILSR